MEFHSIKRSKDGYQLTCTLGGGDVWSCSVVMGSEEEERVLALSVPLQDEITKALDQYHERHEVKSITLKRQKKRDDEIILVSAVYEYGEDKENLLGATRFAPVPVFQSDQYDALARYVESYCLSKYLATSEVLSHEEETA